ncbi:MAG: hypothetical protein JOZ51_19740 [Chloroflexi bacterium]|nr:hypothetical protein [Chloroflexota bacterium]
MDQPCLLDEATLFDYVIGTAAPGVRQAVEQSASCQAVAQQMAREIGPLMQILYRVTCPDVETLVAYQEQRLSNSTQQLVIHKHLSECPLCQEEYALLAEIDAVPLAAPPRLVRRLVEAIFQSPLALPQPLRGDTLAYATERVTIQLRVRAAESHRWNVRGQARTADGQPLDGIEAARLQLIDAGDASFQGRAQAGGIFRFDQVEAGTYALYVQTADEEIVIRELVIGHA